MQTCVLSINLQLSSPYPIQAYQYQKALPFDPFRFYALLQRSGEADSFNATWFPSSQIYQLRAYAIDHRIAASMNFNALWYQRLTYRRPLTVSHSNLIDLNRRPNLLNNFIWWLASYLHGRLGACLYNHSLSPFRHLDAGVPQGSVIEPCLFNYNVSENPQSAPPPPSHPMPTISQPQNLHQTTGQRLPCKWTCLSWYWVG